MSSTTVTIEETRKEQILTAAVAIARTKGYTCVTRDAVAERAQVSAGLVNKYFGTIAALRDQVMLVAIENKCLTVIAQGIAHGSAVALQAPEALRRSAAASVGGGL